MHEAGRITAYSESMGARACRKKTFQLQVLTVPLCVLCALCVKSLSETDLTQRALG